jgi:membrane-associated HD superfamily phosphohydrolase
MQNKWNLSPESLKFVTGHFVIDVFIAKSSEFRYLLKNLFFLFLFKLGIYLFIVTMIEFKHKFPNDRCYPLLVVFYQILLIKIILNEMFKFFQSNSFTAFEWLKIYDDGKFSYSILWQCDLFLCESWERER